MRFTLPAPVGKRKTVENRKKSKDGLDQRQRRVRGCRGLGRARGEDVPGSKGKKREKSE